MPEINRIGSVFDSIASKIERERASSINPKSLIGGMTNADIRKIIIIAQDMYGNTVIVVVILTPRDGKYIPPEHTPEEPPVKQRPIVPVKKDFEPRQVEIEFENCRDDRPAAERITATLASLPKEQRDSVERVSVQGNNPYDPENGSDGPGNKLGWFNPSERSQRDRIFLDSQDTGTTLEHTVAHESFHAFTVQKLLTPFDNLMRTGMDDKKGYGRKMKALWDLFTSAVKNHDRNAFPSRYAESYLDAYRSAVRKARTMYESGRISMQEARLMVMHTLSVGFMEFLAELGSNLEINKASAASQTYAPLRQAYTEMQRVLDAANS